MIEISLVLSYNTNILLEHCQSDRRRNTTPKHLFLKKTAAPRVDRPAANMVEVKMAKVILLTAYLTSVHAKEGQENVKSFTR